MNNANSRYRATTAVVLLLLALSCMEEEPYKAPPHPVLVQALATLEPVFNDLPRKPRIEFPEHYGQRVAKIKLHTREFWVWKRSGRANSEAMHRYAVEGPMPQGFLISINFAHDPHAGRRTTKAEHEWFIVEGRKKFCRNGIPEFRWSFRYGKLLDEKVVARIKATLKSITPEYECR